MTGQRWAKTCSLEIVPPQGEACGRVTAVDMARKLAAEAFFMKGHIALDWRRTESMTHDFTSARVLFLESNMHEIEGQTLPANGEVRSAR